MAEPDVLAAAETILVIDWPTRDVPDTLARGGFRVVVHGGPGPEDYTVYEVEGGEVVSRTVGRPPERADVVYSYRPLDELPEIAGHARALGARAVWIQSGLRPGGEKDPTGCWMPAEASERARQIVESAGMTYVDHPYIADAVRRRE